MILMKKLQTIAFVLPILLFLSIGFSGWTFGPNVIENGNFALNDTPDTALNWSIAPNFYNSTGQNVLINSSVNGDSVLSTSQFQFMKGDAIRVSMDFYPINMTGELKYLGQQNDNGYASIWFDIPVYNELDFNSTFADELLGTNYFANEQISDIGEGWKRITADFMTGYTELSDGVHETTLGIGAFNPQNDGNPYNYILLVDNVSVKVGVHQCVGWECNTMGKMMIQTILALIPLFVVVGIILITRPESVLVLATELMIAGVMSVVMISLI